MRTLIAVFLIAVTAACTKSDDEKLPRIVDGLYRVESSGPVIVQYTDETGGGVDYVTDTINGPWEHSTSGTVYPDGFEMLHCTAAPLAGTATCTVVIEADGAVMLEDNWQSAVDGGTLCGGTVYVQY